MPCGAKINNCDLQIRNKFVDGQLGIIAFNNFRIMVFNLDRLSIIIRFASNSLQIDLSAVPAGDAYSPCVWPPNSRYPPSYMYSIVCATVKMHLFMS